MAGILGGWLRSVPSMVAVRLCASVKREAGLPRRESNSELAAAQWWLHVEAIQA